MSTPPGGIPGIGFVQKHPVFSTVICVALMFTLNNFMDFWHLTYRVHRDDSVKSTSFRNNFAKTEQFHILHSATSSIKIENYSLIPPLPPLPPLEGGTRHIVPVIPVTELPASNILTKDDSEIHDWYDNLKMKYSCINGGYGALYLYHVRKAAGTSIKEVLEHASLRFNVPTYSTEGITFDTEFLKMPGVLTVTTLRDPVKRALSLYWYEHVQWYTTRPNVNEAKKCKTLRQWYEAWKDGAKWKQDFIKKNPNSVYLEIENYYVKMLVGGPTGLQRPADATDLEKAKKILSSFDLVFIAEWLSDGTQIDAMNGLFPGRCNIAVRDSNKGDKSTKAKFSKTLAPDEDEIAKELALINKYDIELFEYAKDLVAKRLKFVPSIIKEVVNATFASGFSKEHGVRIEQTCGSFHRKPESHFDKQINTYFMHLKVANKFPACDLSIRSNEYKPSYLSREHRIGVVQPPGHKGPF